MWYSTRPGNTKRFLCLQGLPSGSPFCRCCLDYGPLGSKPDIKPVFRSQDERRLAVKTSLLSTVCLCYSGKVAHADTP